MPEAPRKKLLADHKKIGKKFFPPASLYGWTEIQYIERIIPEIAWMGYFVVRYGDKDGIKLVSDFVETCFRMKQWGVLPEFCLISNCKVIGNIDWKEITQQLKAKGIYSDCLNALTPFVRCYPQDNPFANLLDSFDSKPPSDKDVEVARTVVSDLFDRRSKSASIVQSMVLRLDLALGKYHEPASFSFRDYDVLIDDFASEQASSMASHVRNHVNSTFMFYGERIGDSWAKYFWNRGKELAALDADNQPPEILGKDKLHPVASFGLDYEQYAWKIVDEIWSKFPADIYESEFAEVIGALLARQCNLAIKVAKNPDLWDFHAGPLFLRPMTDCYITAAWILKDGLDRARKFISYGLGQEKLEIERLKSILDEQSAEDKSQMEKMIEIKEAWINSQHYSFLQQVDIGSWSGISTRKMAEEADCMSLYDFAYTGWSHAAHGAWNHIARYDAFPSPDPLHKHIWQPANLEHGHQVDVVERATQYFDKLCVLLVNEFKIAMNLPNPNAWLDDRLEQFFLEMNGQHSSGQA